MVIRDSLFKEVTKSRDLSNNKESIRHYLGQNVPHQKVTISAKALR